MCCNLQHFSKLRLQIQELSLSHDAVSCVFSNIESKDNPVNTDALQIQTQQIPTPPTFSAVEAYEMLQKPMESACAPRAFTSCRSVVVVRVVVVVVVAAAAAVVVVVAARVVVVVVVVVVIVVVVVVVVVVAVIVVFVVVVVVAVLVVVLVVVVVVVVV